MILEGLTLRSVDVRPVSIPLRRKIVSKVGFFDHWPMILIDLHTDQGITGRSYLEPYLRMSLDYLIPAIKDLATARLGKRIAPICDFQAGQRSLNLVGYEGLAQIAVSGLDMASGTPWRRPPITARRAARRVVGRGPGLQQQRALAIGCRRTRR